MNGTGKSLKEKSLSSEEQLVEENRRSDSSVQLQKREEPETSISLSKSLALELMGLIKAVNNQGVTPETVNASCNAAAQIHKILKLNYDMKKEGF